MPHPRTHRRLQRPPVPRRGNGPAAVAAALLLWLARAATAGDAATDKPSAADAGRATVATVVAGIVSYTRWPAEVKSIRLCAIGQGPGVGELLAAADLGSPQLSVPVRAATAATDAASECDAVYVGSLAGGATRKLLQSTVGRPVLLIGEGQEFCTDGGMFCLDTGAAVRFAVNLDAVARSGLRVNPWVLRIARSTGASRP